MEKKLEIFVICYKHEHEVEFSPRTGCPECRKERNARREK
jgi:hypothetical protein